MGDDVIFKDRSDAGKQLADILTEQIIPSPIVMALPRGGVTVGYEVAQELICPLDIVVVRKLGAPSNPEFAIGAVAEEGISILNQANILELDMTREQLRYVVHTELTELERRVKLYREERSFPQLRGKSVLLVDDGLATGLTMQVAVETIKKHHPQAIIIAVPVAALDIAVAMKELVDDLICLITPVDLNAIGIYYENFPPVEDEEVVKLLKQAQKHEIKNSV